MIHDDALAWSEKVFGGCNLGDVRRTRRLVQMGAAMASSAGTSLNKACEGDEGAREGGYRFLRNDQVDVEALAEGGFLSTVEEARGRRLLLGVEDSTTLAYRHSVAEELGDLGGPANAKQRGWWAHSVVLVDADTEETVGLLEQRRWVRDVSERGKAKERRNRPYEEKESHKWQESSERMSGRLASLMERVISVCDREADVYQYLQYKVSKGERFLVRVERNRALNDDNAYLWERVRSWSERAQQTIEVEQRGGPFARKKRQATLSVSAGEVMLKPPCHAKEKLAPLKIRLVYAREVNTPEGLEPLEWLLFTSEPIEAAQEILEVLRYYRLRWRVEDWHKAWKSGCAVEEQRMQSAEHLERMLVILAFVAIRLLQLREQSGATPLLSCEDLLETDEWQCLWASVEKKPMPERAPSHRWAYEALGKLGGWRPNKTGRIGWQTLWDGYFKLKERLFGWRLAQEIRGSKM